MGEKESYSLLGNLLSNRLDIVAAVALALSVGYFVQKIAKKKSRLPSPPGPKGHFIFGNLGIFPNIAKGESFATVELQLAKEHGLVYTLDWPEFFGKMIVISDPELVKKVFVTKNVRKSFIYDELSAVLGAKSIVTLKGGPEWARQRKAFNPGFSPKHLKIMAGTMVSKFDKFLEGVDSDIQQNKATNMLLRSQNFTSDVILSVAFGEDWNKTDEPHPARRLEDEVLRLFTVKMMNPLQRIFGVKLRWDTYQKGKLLEKEMLAILERRLAEGGANKTENKDILSLVLTHMKEESGGAELTHEDKLLICDQLKAFYFAGE
jgi:cytochrome P450